MQDWREKVALYEVHEVSRKSHEVYTMKATGQKISDWCRLKQENYGYIEGLGGDKSYSCWAVEMYY